MTPLIQVPYSDALLRAVGTATKQQPSSLELLELYMALLKVAVERKVTA